MSKLDKLADEWVAQGLYGSADEAAQAVERVMDLHHADRQRDADELGQRLVQSYRDVAAGRVIKSTGDYKRDKAEFAKREAEDWK